MKNFRDLKIWSASHNLALEIYNITKKFPSEEKFGITSQLRRASLSIPTNIAEGCGRGNDSDFSRFLQIAFGSASEVEYLLLFSFELKFLNETEYLKFAGEIVEIKKSISALIKKLHN